jgi:hypothetical protein
VIDTLRAWLDRPLPDGDRRRMFGLAVAVIVAGAAGFALLDHPGPPARHVARRAPSPARRAPPAAAPPAGAALHAPSEEGRPPAALQATRTDVAAAKRAAGRFLAGYLPYTYGRRDPRSIAAAAPQLVRRLESQRPRVPAGERRRRPRVVLVQADAAGPVIARATALVSDGARRYTVPLRLARQRSGWKVIDVES